MKIKMFLIASCFMFNSCLGMEKFVASAYRFCNVPLQSQYAYANASYALYKNKDESFFDYVVKNNMTLVAKDILDKYDELQETSGQAIQKIGERQQLCGQLFMRLVRDQNYCEASQLVCDTLKKDERKLEGTKQWTGFELPPATLKKMQEIFTWVVKKGQLTSVKMLIDSGFVKIDQHVAEWAENKGAYLVRTALEYKYPKIADYLFKKGLDECAADQNLNPFGLVECDIIRVKGGEAFLCDLVIKDKFKEARLYNFMIAAVQTKHCSLASDWVDQMVQKNKWEPGKFLQAYTKSNKGHVLLERYGVAYDKASGNFKEKSIFNKEKLKTLKFLAQFSNGMHFAYRCDDKKKIDKEILLNQNNVKYALALGWAFNCKQFHLNCCSLSNYGIKISSNELDQLVIDNAQEIGLPELKTVEDVQEHRALMLNFRKEKLDAIRNEAIKNNKYPIDWEGEFAKFNQPLLDKKAFATAQANRIANVTTVNHDYAKIDYLNSLKRGLQS